MVWKHMHEPSARWRLPLPPTSSGEPEPYTGGGMVRDTHPTLLTCMR
jgi:hypothetical protein